MQEEDHTSALLKCNLETTAGTHIVLLADNLNGGSARLAECFISDLVTENSISKNNVFLHIFYSTNLVVQNDPRIIKYPVKLSGSFFFNYLKRCFFINKFRSDIFILNLTNFPIPDFFIKKNKKQITLIHNAYLVCFPKCFVPPSFKFTLAQFIKKLFFLMTVFFSKKAFFVLQTNWIKKKTEILLSKFFMKRDLSVIPFEAHVNMLFKFTNVNNNVDMRKPFWFYPAAFYPHKNHYFLIEIGKKIKENCNNLRIFITISELEKDAINFMEAVTLNGLSNIIINIGWTTQEKTYEYFQQAKGLLFLSTFESLGLPLLEAFTMEKKIIAANIESSIEILGEYPFYINIFDSNAVEECYREMVKKSHIKMRKAWESVSIFHAYYTNFMDKEK